VAVPSLARRPAPRRSLTNHVRLVSASSQDAPGASGSRDIWGGHQHGIAPCSKITGMQERHGPTSGYKGKGTGGPDDAAARSERQRRSPVGWEYVLRAVRSSTDLATVRGAPLTATSALWPALRITGTGQLKARADLVYPVVGSSMPIL